MRQSSLFIALAVASLPFAYADELALFNGKDLATWQEPHGTWSAVGSVSIDPANPKAFIAAPGGGVLLNSATAKTVNLISQAEHGDCEIHVEFTVPPGSNSGVYVMGRYEVQILDSFGKDTINEHDCGAIYERWKDGKGYEGHPPRVNASKPPGEWQTFDITFRAPRFDADGRKTENARFVKVVQNGTTIHENVEVTGPTRGSRFETEAPTGPILLQGDHGPVAFKTIRMVSHANIGRADEYHIQECEGWTVHVSQRLLAESSEKTAAAMTQLREHLAGITRAIPEPALSRLREVPLWISPEYDGVKPKAEYHPNPQWLREHRRNPAMAKAVEFTNVRIFEAETRRMPVFVLHELAHSYHDRVLGFSNPEIIAAYKDAVRSKSYDSVERRHGDGRPSSNERAYAMTNEREYFAECTEAFFGINDFYPFTRADLEQHDPNMAVLLAKLWGCQ